MKQYGILGKGSGKLGSSVFAIIGGEQIVRQYNPVVSNPNSPAQVAQRAKLKLMSQIAADLAPIIAIPKDGLKSSRNIFVSKNIGLCGYDNDAANVKVDKLQITAGSAAFPKVLVQTVAEGIQVNLDAAAASDVEKVVYCLFKVGEDFQLSLEDSVVVKDTSSAGVFPSTFHSELKEGLVLAYGIRESVAGEAISYGNYDAGDATGIAELAVTRKIKNAASSFTATTGSRFYNI